MDRVSAARTANPRKKTENAISNEDPFFLVVVALPPLPFPFAFFGAMMKDGNCVPIDQ
jgi:hypothetical protein